MLVERGLHESALHTFRNIVDDSNFQAPGTPKCLHQCVASPHCCVTRCPVGTTLAKAPVLIYAVIVCNQRHHAHPVHVVCYALRPLHTLPDPASAFGHLAATRTMFLHAPSSTSLQCSICRICARWDSGSKRLTFRLVTSVRKSMALLGVTAPAGWPIIWTQGRCGRLLAQTTSARRCRQSGRSVEPTTDQRLAQH